MNGTKVEAPSKTSLTDTREQEITNSAPECSYVAKLDQFTHLFLVMDMSSLDFKKLLNSVPET